MMRKITWSSAVAAEGLGHKCAAKLLTSLPNGRSRFEAEHVSLGFLKSMCIFLQFWFSGEGKHHEKT